MCVSTSAPSTNGDWLAETAPQAGWSMRLGGFQIVGRPAKHARPICSIRFVRMTFRTAMTVSAEVENQAAVDRVHNDPRGILTRLERVWDVIDDAGAAEKAGSPRPPEDAILEVPFAADDVTFIRQRLDEGITVGRELLANAPDATWRIPYEESLELLLRASEELRKR